MGRGAWVAGLVLVLAAGGLAGAGHSYREGAAPAFRPKGNPRMKQEFAHPPLALRPLQIVHGMEGVVQAGGGEVGAGLDRLLALGMGGVVANVAWNDYLRNEAAWEAFLAGYRAAKARGMEFWIYDEEGYPSGAAGHLVLEGNPEYEACGLICLQARVAGGQAAELALPERARAWVCASTLPMLGDRPRLEGAAAVPVPGDRSPVRWSNPGEGPRLLVAFVEQAMYEDTHCTTNVFAKRRYINIMSREAVAKFIRLTHDAYAQRLGKEMAGVRAFFTDEPSLMTAYLAPLESPRPPALPWERTLPERFAREAGYPLEPVLPALFLDLGRDSRRVRSAFYWVVADQVAEAFFAPIQERCRALGVASSGHVLCEERLSWNVWFEGDYFRAVRRMDLPGIDILTSHPAELVVGDNFLTPKLASSVAHLVGSERVMSETSDFVQRMAKGRASIEQMLATAALQYALGVNLITSYYPWHDYGDDEQARWLQGTPGAATGYRLYNDFVGRLGAVMVGGEHRCDIALYYPVETMQAYFGLTDRPYWQEGIHGPEAARCEAAFRDLGRALLCSQRDFDVLDREALERGRIREGRLQAGRESYRALVFPGTRVVPVAVLERARTLQRAGGLVVFATDLPREAPDPAQDHEVTALVSKLVNAGALVVPEGMDLPAALGGLPPQVTLQPATREVIACRRHQQGREICLLVNYADHPVSLRARIAGMEGPVELWWPDTGEMVPVADLARHTITLAGYRSVVVVK